MVGSVVGAATHIPINNVPSSSTNFADVLASSYNISIADYNEQSTSAEDRRVETLLGQSGMHEASCETPYGSGHFHSHTIQHLPPPYDSNVDSFDRRYSNTCIVPSSTGLSLIHI